MIRSTYDPSLIKLNIRDAITRDMVGFTLLDIEYISSIYTRMADIISKNTEYTGNFISVVQKFEPDTLIDLREYCEKISNISHPMIPDLYYQLHRVADTVFTGLDDINRKFDFIESITNASESAVKTKNAMKSIKDERVIYSNFSFPNFIVEGDATIDKRYGFLTLGIDKTVNVPFVISKIEFNKPKGSLNTPSPRDESDSLYNNGIFHNRMFSDNPIFENIQDANPANVRDNDLSTTLAFEYNTTNNEDKLKVDMVLDIKNEHVDDILIISDLPDNISVLEQNKKPHKYTKVEVTSNGEAKNIMDGLTYDSIVINGIPYESERSHATISPIDIYPTMVYPVNRSNCSSISMSMESTSPQTIYYPEYYLYDKEGTLMYKLNYFETLLVNNYTSPENRPNPMDVYSSYEKMRFFHMYNISPIREIKEVKLYRYALGIKEIVLRKHIYKPKSDAISSNLNPTDKLVTSIELYSNEYHTSPGQVKYYISSDKLTWMEIIPSNFNQDGVKRYIFDELLQLRGNSDKLVSIDTQSIYLKISLTKGEQIPYVKSFAVRLKLS